MSPEEVDAYAKGLTAGGKWFNSGIDAGAWIQPITPYKKGSPEAEAWERGLWHAFGDLEDAYFS